MATPASVRSRASHFIRRHAWIGRVLDRWRALCRHPLLRHALYRISPSLLLKYRYWITMGKWIRWDRVSTYSEKLLWLNLHWRHPLKTRCGDKYEMRGWVEEQGWGSILPPLLAVYDRVADIDPAALPERFALKGTHGCHYNIICPDKRQLDWPAAQRKLERWMREDFSRLHGELHYAGMRPRLILEPFLDDGSGHLPADYKIYCCGGKAHCILTCHERDLVSYDAKFAIYDRDWTRLLPYLKGHSVQDPDPRPAGHAEMIAAAEALSLPFPFVRMDFYLIHGRPILGEMTFTPCTCIDGGYTDLAQATLGALIPLPEPVRG